MDTIYRPADTDNDILRKILVQYGGFPRPGDFDNSFYRKILTQLGGTFRPGDGTSELLRKIAVRVGAGPRPGDTTNKLLYRIDQSLATEPRPGDYDNILLRKWLSPNALAPTPGTTITIIPKVDPPHTQAEVTVNIIGGDNLVGFWLGFWVLEYSTPAQNISANYQLKDAKFISGMPFTTTFSIPIPSVNPSTVCVAIVKGPTQASVSSNPLKVKGAYRQCFTYVSDFTVVNFGSAPAAPVATAATSLAETSFSANWNASATATSYRLDVSTVNNFASFVAGYNNLNVGNVLTQSVTGLTGGTTYYFRVRAVNGFGTSPDSNVITSLTVPAAPVATAASSVTTTTFAANWNSSTGASSYRLDVATDAGFTSFVSGFNDLNVGNVTTASVTGLTAATTYYYRVRAVDASGTSASSNTITQDTLAAAPTATASTSVTDVTFSANWGAVTGATSYRLDVATDAGFTSFVSGYNDLNVGNVVTASVTGLTENTTYYFRVRTVNGGGTSGNSNTITTLTYFTETQDWVNRVVSNSGTVSTTTKDAANTLLSTINGVSGLRAKILRLNLFAGGQFAAAQVPFIKDKGSSLDNPKVGASGTTGSGSDWTYAETGAGGGLKPSTSQAWLHTNFVSSTDWTSDNDAGISVYACDSTTQAGVPIGTFQFASSNQCYMLIAFNGLNNSYGNMWNNEVAKSDSTRKGFYTLSRTASNLWTLYRNGSSLGTEASPGGARPSNGIMAVFAEGSNTGISTTNFYTKLLAGYAIHLGLTSGDASSLNSAFQTFNTALTRNV